MKSNHFTFIIKQKLAACQVGTLNSKTKRLFENCHCTNYLTTHTSLSPIRRGFAPGFVNCKKGCTRLAAASDKVYQLLAHGRWFSPGTTASSTTKTGRRDIAEILLKMALNTKYQSINLLKQKSCPYWI
jgi:hypothetical protein